jgi:hypothetical protein
MKHATMRVLDQNGSLIWSGSVMQYIRDNELDRGYAIGLIDTLVEARKRSELVAVSGGAGPVLYVALGD